MSQFYYPADLHVERIILSEQESKHALNVLRLEVGATIQITNGNGARAEGNVELIGKKKCILQVTKVEQLPPERSATIHLAIAPTKRIDRYEWFLEKAVEIGVDRITPILTEHSERRKLRHDRSLKIMIAAMKQSQRSWLPQLDELTTLKKFLQEEHVDQKAFGWCTGTHASFMDQYTREDTLLLIGPEGDFSTTEAESLQAAGFNPVSIGTTRLRTETAALAPPH